MSRTGSPEGRGFWTLLSSSIPDKPRHFLTTNSRSQFFIYVIRIEGLGLKCGRVTDGGQIYRAVPR